MAGVRMVTHPLLESPIPVGPEGEAKANRRLAERRELLSRYEHAGEWECAVRMHNPDYWSQALLRYANELPDDAYWRLAGWCYREHLWTVLRGDDWRKILSAARPGRREHLMTDDERNELYALEEVVTVMRGYRLDSAERGLSWTRSREVAERFARDAFAHDNAAPRIAHGTVARECVIAVFLTRGEDEIVARPEDVTITGADTLSEPP